MPGKERGKALINSVNRGFVCIREWDKAVYVFLRV